MINLGLAMGVKALWQEDLLWDYTIKVQGEEFKAHKVVLASVSQYFKAMFGKGFMESKTDEVELKGLSADTVSKLLEFIYTREEKNITDNTLDILRCAMYLQMPQVAEFCIKQMLKDLNVRTCLEALSAFMEYSFSEEIESAKHYIKLNWKTVVECSDPVKMSFGVLQVLLNYWEKTEWERFLFIKDWYSKDPENRKGLVNDVLSQVRFCLIPERDVKSIAEMDLFRYTKGPWHKLVEKALKYHKLPINLKVLVETEQSAARTEPAPLFFTTGSNEDPSTFFTIDQDNTWKKYENKVMKMPNVTDAYDTVGIEVNNFFVVCTRGDEKKEWHIFDPRTLTWSRIANMPHPKELFAMVHHRYHIYTLGGQYLPDKPTRKIEQYNFLTDTWSSLGKFPVSVTTPVASVIGDTIYVTGGSIRPIQQGGPQFSNKLYCLDLSSSSCKWKKKVSSLYNHHTRAMFTLTMLGEECLIIVDWFLDMQFYSPSRNHWSALRNDIRPDIYDNDWSDYSLFLARGNSLFILHVEKPIFVEDELDDIGYRYICLNWRVPENAGMVTDVAIEDFPVTGNELNSYGAMLAIPPKIWF